MQLFREFDRLTAYMCRLRGVEFDEVKCREAWERYQESLPVRCPEPIWSSRYNLDAGETERI